MSTSGPSGPSGPIVVGDVVLDANGVPTGESLLYPCALSVSGTHGEVVDVDVTLTSLTHAFPADMDVVLVSPTGTAVTLMSDLGGNTPISAPGSTLVFDDEAAPTPSAGLPRGRYRPSEDDSDPTDIDDFRKTQTNVAFSALDGAPSANGTWAMYVCDDGPLDDGSIGSWSITIETSDPPIARSTVIPVVTSPVSGALLPSSTLPVRGTASPGSTVFTRADQQPARAVLVGPDGGWATNFTGLADGSHTVTVSPMVSAFSTSPVTVTLHSAKPTGILTLRTVTGQPGLTSSRRVYLHSSGGRGCHPT